MSEQNDWIGWHFLREDKRLGYDDGRLVVVGETLKMPEGTKLELRHVGLHASRKALDALRCAPGPIVCRVRLSGDIIEGEDKAVASERTVLAIADATNVLHEFACWCAESVLHLTGNARPVCENAIATKRRWMKGEVTDQELSAAWDAAGSAAWSVAWSAAWSAARDAARDSAWYAAWDSARDTSWDAAWSAAWDAAWDASRDASRDATRDAAWDASRDAQEAKLNEILNELLDKEN